MIYLKNTAPFEAYKHNLYQLIHNYTQRNQQNTWPAMSLCEWWSQGFHLDTPSCMFKNMSGGIRTEGAGVKNVQGHPWHSHVDLALG